MAVRLHEFDKERIDRGLQAAVNILEKHGAMSSSKLLQHDEAALLAFFEALCCVSYLSEPSNRQLFNVVFQKTQEKKPLRLGHTVIPTMTVFLFQEDPIRHRFARMAWASLPAQSLTTEQFDWAVNDHLAAAMQAVSVPNTPLSQIQRFWEGVLVILDALSEDLIVHSLRGMEAQPDLYNLAVEHLCCNSDQILALVVKALCALMEKSASAFWNALSLLNPPQLPLFVVGSPAFASFVSRSLDEDMLVADGTRKTPLLVYFIKTFMRSLPTNRRSDPCEAILRRFFDTKRADIGGTREGQAACILAGLAALQLTLDGFLDPKYRLNSGNADLVKQVTDVTTLFAGVIIQAAQLQPNDRYNIGISQTAIVVVEAALALDTRSLHEEWKSLEKDMAFCSLHSRESAPMWTAFSQALAPGRLDLARAMLMPTLSLRGVQKFLPPKLGKQDFDKAIEALREQFNRRFGDTAEAIARVMDRISEFSMADLNTLCGDLQIRTIDPIVASLIHGDDAIREAGKELINSITGEDERPDAILTMAHEFPDTFLRSFSETVDKVTVDTQSRASLDPWPPMPNIQTCSRDILNGLCDTGRGLLRTQTLSSLQKKAVRHWWQQTWQFVDYSFLNVRGWSQRRVEKNDLEDFCRDVIELADHLLAQDGVVASACSSSVDPDAVDGGERARIMKDVLEAPRKFSSGFIEMVQLKDPYLLSITVKVLVKLFRRLNEYGIPLPEKVLVPVRRACTPHPNSAMEGKYLMNTNLVDTQRAELLSVLGPDADPEVEFISSAPVSKDRGKEKEKKQSTIDAWSRAGSSAAPNTAASSSSSDIVSQLTPNFNRVRLEKPKRPLPPKADQKALLDKRQALRDARARDQAEFQKSKAEAIARAKALRTGSSIVPGEGSGIRGVAGAFGKDHAPKKSDIMVDSESEEDYSDGDDDDAALAQQSKKGDKALDEAERRRRLALQELARGPVKKIKVQRSAKALQARLIPPMEKLHQAILEWDIFHDGNDPPNGYKCESVAKAYISPAKYRETFFPLLVYEAWRSFVTSKDETTAKPFGIKVTTRMSVDNFLEVSTTMPVAASRERQLSEGDIVLLSKSTDPLNNKSEPHCLARIWKTTYKKEVLEVAYRLSSRGNQILPVLLPGAEFHAIKITNMTTIEREYAALESLQYYDLMDEVLKAAPSPILKFGDQAVASVQQNYELNRGQAVAILNAKENDGFTLVQGPPGTGKTKTIVAMVGALMTGVPRANASAVAVARPGHAQNGAAAPLPKKLLVCAPSNAAVDELVLRLKQGVREMNGTRRQLSVLRLGRSEAINAAVKDVTLDELVKAELEKLTGNGGGPSDREKLHQRAGEIKAQLAELFPALEAARCGDDRNLANKLQREHDVLRAEQRRIGAQIDRDKDSGNTYAREAEIKRRQIQQKILNEADVLCATLSGSGHEMFKNLSVEFETVIIDEAAQCVELSALIPLKYGCAKCILVGDPKQLPPTVLSQSAARYGYDQSLFVRMQTNHPEDVHLLDTQYRMHPEISLFPSQEFYERRLVDGSGMAELRKQPWHDSSLLGPYRFFDVEGVQEKGRRGQSLVNANELQVALQLYKRFRTDYSHLDLKGKIGIITPYKAQLFALRQRFTEQYGEAITEEIEFNTTDAFQGRECEIIIFSCVRASPTGGIGFMTDIRRMNVGLTRAKSSLWILGDSRALRQGEYWYELIKNAKARDRYTSGDILGMLRVPGRKGTPPAAASGRPGPGGAAAAAALPAADRPGPQNTASPDVEMMDIMAEVTQPPPRKLPQPPRRQPSTYTVVDRNMPPTAQGLYGSRAGGINERGEALPATARGSERPTVHTSQVPTKKRQLDVEEQAFAPAPKRVSFQSSQPSSALSLAFHLLLSGGQAGAKRQQPRQG